MPPRALPPGSIPPQPVYILRGHATPIHALTFLSQNTLLLTGDASGVCILWRLSTRRPIAVWAAHSTSLLAVREWTPNRIITHGRDHKIRVWKTPTATNLLSTVLPIDTSDADLRRTQCPWLVAVLDVNALNFCGFGFCEGSAREVCTVAVPSALDSSAIDVFELPSTRRIHTRITAPEKTGMAMALGLRSSSIVAGYESGHVVLFQLVEEKWEAIFTAQPHTQPVLSLTLLGGEGGEGFLTTSADAVVARYREGVMKTVETGHAGLQGVGVRSDGRLFVTAGWDGRFRVFGVKSMKELAVLSWHRVGCYAAAFADILDEDIRNEGVEVDVVVGVEEARTRKESRRHWIAGGAKDGKVSLWEIY